MQTLKCLTWPYCFFIEVSEQVIITLKEDNIPIRNVYGVLFLKPVTFTHVEVILRIRETFLGQ